MKISTIRSLLMVADGLAILAVFGVIYLAYENKKAAAQREEAFSNHIVSRLDEIQPVARAATNSVDTGRYVGLDLGNRPPPPEVKPTIDPEKTEVKPTAAPVATPLDQVISLIGLQAGREDEVTMALYVRLDEKGGGTGPSPSLPTQPIRPGGPGGARPLPTSPLGRPVTPVSLGGGTSQSEIYKVSRGEGIEAGSGFVAVLKDVAEGRAIFEYAGKEVLLDLPDAPDAGGRTAAPGAKASSEPAAEPTEDPATWVSWDAQRPAVVQLTPAGIASLKAKGDEVLEGVRWATESVPDRGKTRPAVKVTSIPPNSVLAKAGFQTGDVVLSINGTDVSSRGDIANYVRGNPDSATYQVRILTRGTVVTRTIRRP